MVTYVGRYVGQYMVDLLVWHPLIYRQTLGQYVDRWYLPVLEQQMFLIHGDYSFNCQSSKV